MTLDQDMRNRFEAEEFLLREAELLDERRYDEWLATLTDDVLYWAPAIESVDRNRHAYNHVGLESEMAFFHDTRATLQMRVDRLSVGGAWAEIPPSRTRHFVSNVRITGIDGDEWLVRSNFFLFRSRLEVEEDHYYGAREDRLRSVDGVLKLAKRKIVLAQTVLTARSITTFF